MDSSSSDILWEELREYPYNLVVSAVSHDFLGPVGDVIDELDRLGETTKEAGLAKIAFAFAHAADRFRNLTTQLSSLVEKARAGQTGLNDFVLDLKDATSEGFNYVYKNTLRNQNVMATLARNQISLSTLVLTLKHLLSTISSLESFAREGYAPKIEPVNLDTIFVSALSRYPDYRNNIHLNFARAHKLNVDVGMFRIITRNLIDNSIKYRHSERSLVVIVESRRVKTTDAEYQVRSYNDSSQRRDYDRVLLRERSDWIELTITDNGVGIPADHEEIIFRLTRRANDSVSGDGVGLALCRWFVRLHHGIIFAQPGREYGARFTLLIPQYNF